MSERAKNPRINLVHVAAYFYFLLLFRSHNALKHKPIKVQSIKSGEIKISE